MRCKKSRTIQLVLCNFSKKNGIAQMFDKFNVLHHIDISLKLDISYAFFSANRIQSHVQKLPGQCQSQLPAVISLNAIASVKYTVVN